MPRRKKSGQSPARVPGGPPELGSLGPNAAYQQTPTASNFPGGGTSLSSSAREDTVRSMQEMFAHLDPEVIDIVLSECDFNVENAMDSLLELSLAAEGAAPVPSPVSGFERTAAALLSPTSFSASNPEPDSDMPLQQLPSSPSSPKILTEELDLLLDQEFEKLTSQQETKDELQGGQYLSAFPPLPFKQQVLPELLQPSLQPGSGEPSAGLVGHTGASVTCDQRNPLKVEMEQQADFTYRMTGTPADMPKPPMDLAASGRPSAFQVYKKQEVSHTYSEKAAMPPSESIVGGTRSKVNMLNQRPIGNMQSPWNMEVPAFSPHVSVGQEPVFITPVVQPSSNWSSLPINASPWSNQGPVVQAPLKPSATIPKSWALPAPNSPGHNKRLRLQGRVLVLLRGAPGSGKSTLARALVEHNPGAVSLSTDDYFTCDGEYHFDPDLLGEAHVWNQKRVKEAFEKGANPIIIDNTNMQGWEMRPYVAQALKHRYKVLFREPDTWWKNKPRELERRSMHNVPAEKIRRMLNGYERFVTVQSIMGSNVPESKERLPNNSLQSVPTEAPCPDLVGQHRLPGECIKLHPQLFCPLPDVSSIGQSTEVETPGDILHKSTESFDCQPTGRFMEYPEMSEEDMGIDMSNLDPLLDAQLELNHLKEDHRIPDCIVESVMNEDPHGENMPVAFSDSIGQRVRRERQSRRSTFEHAELADLVKGTSLSNSNSEVEQKIKEDESKGTGLANDGVVKKNPQTFDGDWPTEESLEQRPMRKREKHKKREENEGTGVSQHDIKDKTNVQLGPKLTEFQKLLDLIQTGVPNTETSISPLSSSSPSSNSGELEQDEASRGDCEGEGELDLNRADRSTGELPDCVLGWKAAESCKETDLSKENITGNKESCIMGVYGGVFDSGKEMRSASLKSVHLSNDPADISKSLGSNAQNSECGFYTEPQSGLTDVNTKMYAQNDTEIGASSQISEVSPSAELEAESNVYSGGSQDRKQSQGRRSGKQCKLALTFTQNCAAPTLNTLERSNSSGQSVINRQESINMDSGQSQTPRCDSSLNQEPNEPLTEVKFEAQMKPPSPPDEADERFSTQTEPQDFAFLWRLNQNPGVSQPSDIRVLSGNSCFVPHLSAPGATAAQPSDHREVPYRVVHEKGTQVEETELGAAQDRLGDLCILRRHFKEVSYDTLVDLYDKCHQDLDWTTNLLLDSGEMFSKDEDSEIKDDDCNTSISCEALERPEETRLLPNAADENRVEHLLSEVKEETPQSSSGTINELNENSSNVNGQSFKAPLALLPDTNTDNLPQKELSVPAAEHSVEQDNNQEHGARTGSYDDHFFIEELRFETEEDIASMNEILRVLQEELDKLEGEERHKGEWRPDGRLAAERGRRHLDIQSVELRLSTEVALQLTELFGPVGVDPGACSADDYAVQMDLNLAKMLHQKWKETIEEKQKNVALSFHLLQEGSKHWAQSPVINTGPRDRKQPQPTWTGADGWATQSSQSDASNLMPIMDHWNASHQFVSLRDIIKEEQALQDKMEKARRNRAVLDRKDGAALLKENQLYALFPTIDRHFLQDIFRDHNYSLTETELFLHSLLGEEPVKTVVAETARSNHVRAASKEREMRQKPLDLIEQHYQDTEDPEYEDFRAEACLHRRKQLESFSKAAEAFKGGRKEVASFYAEQGHLYGRQMRQANHRAAVQIFERVNRSLLPKNILDLHGLHVDEALTHLAQVLEDKTSACEQGLCRPQLSVITGRGNHSQGGVPRIRPAVIDYLTNNHYRFTEPNLGLLLVSLK